MLLGVSGIAPFSKSWAKKNPGRAANLLLSDALEMLRRARCGAKGRAIM